MYLEEFVKSFDIYKNLEKEIKNNIIQNCYIINSNDKEILNVFSILLSQRLVENNSYILEGNPELNLNIKTYSENEQMNVETAQQIIQNSQSPPKLPNSNKVFILDFFQTPTTIVQNKLLKTIEEPFYNSKYIIKTNNYYSILDTIKSRSRLINIKTINKEDLFEFSKKQEISKQEFEKIYSVCPEVSDFINVVINKNNERIKIRDLVIYTLNNLSKENFQKILLYLQKELYNKIDVYLDVFMLLTKDIIESRLTNKISINDLDIVIEYPLKFYLKIQDSIIRGLTNFRFKQASDFIIRNFILEIMEDRYKCKK